MPYAVRLDCVGSGNPIFDGDGDPVLGDYIEISFEQYAAAVSCLISGKHVRVVDGALVLEYQPADDGP
ncbi:hypothetical protein GR204_24320 [Rhizobium leguminosarum]|uniref:Uncharacterized protein n=1 Tax=Rhizobium leguminosarum TaxID=384 RepID=A0A6P0BDX6_RHILE|nr:hypothetical protein [Rhizobium leguminosarum]NEI37074.1 hypothetical protein [Rhizobium leguminosarum]NEI43550.1 hypothetical protein [Rhizobium leguminosarum]